MISIDNSLFKFKIKEENNKEFIFDEVRKKWIMLTPEEWVRQNFIQYLIVEKQYPKSLMAVEKLIKVNNTSKRFDIVVYKNNQVYLLVECKQEELQLNENTLQQILAYQSSLQAKIMVLTNGCNTFAFEVNENKIIEKKEIPSWN